MFAREEEKEEEEGEWGGGIGSVRRGREGTHGSVFARRCFLTRTHARTPARSPSVPPPSLAMVTHSAVHDLSS